jgi:hypothetical protein
MQEVYYQLYSHFICIKLIQNPLELFLGIFGNKLRFFTADGELLPSSEELVEQERQRAELAEQEIARLKEQLRISVNSYQVEPEGSVPRFYLGTR